MNGQETKTYVDAAGVGQGTWSEVLALGDVDNPDSFNTNPQNTKESEAETVVLGDRVTQIGFTMNMKLTDPVFTILNTAFNSKAVIGVAHMLGDIATVGTQGMQFDGKITQFNKSYPKQNHVQVAVIIQPAYEGDIKPSWVTISGP